ncbi:hypothetical protein LTR95_000077 [Oleoguttula sp. CCFEE 5521]
MAQSSAGSSINDAPVASDLYRRPLLGQITTEFYDLDSTAAAQAALTAASSLTSRNFVLDFGDDAATAAFDLSQSAIERLPALERSGSTSARWINLWYPAQQQNLIEILAKRYDFTPRLLALMCSDPRQSRSPTSSRQTITKSPRSWGRRASPTTSTESEIEKGGDELAEHCSIASNDSSGSGNLYRIINDIWHYSSIDLGRSYVCLGFNSIYGTRLDCSTDSVADSTSILPHCTRVWTWLVLCEDSTIITIHEDPFPYSDPSNLSAFQRRILAETRRNLLNVFRSLSQLNPDPLQAKNPMTLLPLRARTGSTAEETAYRALDAPGLLFYYLFENWHNSYTLITRKESRYGMELAHLRKEMFAAPKLHIIDRLDCIGRELGVLRRHYESYNRLIDRLLEPRDATAASLQNSRASSESSEASIDTIRPAGVGKASTLGVSLSSASRVRFARLKDLIDLYALSELEEYLRQKDSLISLNFSLLTLKESLDVERLTRITLLLTKMTIPFLPLSLMTAYYSVPLKDVAYSVGQFWIAFCVILAISVGTLVVFGVASGSMQFADIRAGWRRLGRVLGRIGGRG